MYRLFTRATLHQKKRHIWYSYSKGKCAYMAKLEPVALTVVSPPFTNHALRAVIK